MKILAAVVLTVSLACSACSGKDKSVTVYVDPPPTGDSSCIGVVGFEIAMDSGTGRWESGPLLGMSPVLDPTACRIARPFAIDGVPLDVSLTVSVFGYDSARVARVSGSAQIPDLSGAPVKVPLHGVAGVKADVLVIARRPLLGGAALADVTRMVIATQMRPQTLLDVDASLAGPYFFEVEPGAFGVDAVPDPDLTADFTLTQGSAPPRARLTATQTNSYWQTQAR